MIESASRALVTLAVLLTANAAHANGRMPGANEFVIAPRNPAHMLVRATYGVAQSFDRGASFALTCEEAIGASGVIADPPITLTSDGTLVLLPPTGGALISHDTGCSFLVAPAPLAGTRGADLTRDPSDARRVLVLTSTVTAIDSRGFTVVDNTLVETRDDARTWQLVATLPSDFEAETVEVAPSNPRRIYVSGTASDDPRLGVLFRSDDGGQSWTKTTLALPAGSGSLFVSAVHPLDPDRLWVRVPARGDTLGLLPARLLVSRDQGRTFTELAATTRAMFGFALSPDGSELAYGGPADGLFVGASEGQSGFEKVSAIGVRCLRWSEDGALYACGTEPSDPFSVAVSQDRGRTFAPLYALRDTCPQLCPEPPDSVCRVPWPSLATRLRADTSMCETPWAHVDAGSTDAIPDASAPPSDAALAPARDADLGSDAASETPIAEAHDGCACRVGAASTKRPLDVAWLVLLLMLCTRRRLLLVRMSLLALFASCGEANEHDPDEHAPSATYQGCPASTPPFALGMEALGRFGRIGARLLEARPAPPARYRNDWELEFIDGMGRVLEDVAVVRARPFMPVHGHDGNITPTVRPLANRVALDYLNLNMRGPWEIQLTVHSSALGDDEIVFHVCVPE